VLNIAVCQIKQKSMARIKKQSGERGGKIEKEHGPRREDAVQISEPQR